jgi:ubiquitin-protein ligase
MDTNRITLEAQQIAAKYKFFMVKGQINHLYGYIYESPDGKTKYAIDIIFDDNFPTEPPQISFRQEIPNMPAEIQLETLNNWNPNSKVVNVIDELSLIVKDAVGVIEPKKDHEQIPKLPQQQQSKSVPNEQSITDSNAGISNEDQNPIQAKPIGSKIPEKSAESTSEEYLTPDLNQYPDQMDDQWVDGQQFEEWTSDVQEENSSIPEEPLEEEPQEQNVENTVEKKNVPKKTEPMVESENEGDITLATESAMVQQEYAMDYIEGNLSIIEIYLTITIEQTFIIRINFSDYPKRPKLEIPEGIKKLLGEVNSSLEILKKWNEKKPAHIVEIIRELEGKLWFLTELEVESKMISGEYKADMIDGVISNLRITIYTYGFKEYTLDLDISKYPAQPKITYSQELTDLIKTPIEAIKSYREWKRKESHSVDILREIQWLVDKNSRINFEIALLRGGMKEVNYNTSENKITAQLAGKMKTEGVSFNFEVLLSPDYPMSAPKIELKSELEDKEDLKKKLTEQISKFTSSWHQFNYLIDLFNEISKAIFEVSVVSCVICHKIECPQCGKKISSPTESDQCQVQCPSCERIYHKSCWSKTITSFHKCGFCLKPAPPELSNIDCEQ